LDPQVEDSLHEKQLAGKAGGLLALDRLIKSLKLAQRTGWLDRGVDPLLAESVADHSLGVALLAWVAALERQAEGEALDPQRVLSLSLLHDLAEAETGDWPPYDPRAIPEADDPVAWHAFLNHRHERNEERSAAKRAAEDAVMARLFDALPDVSRHELSGIWAELRAGVSAEARFVKQVDRLETFLQSRNYRRDAPDLPVASFRQEVLETLDDPLLAALRDAALEDDSPK
jgi:putative hydrolase of HD superfamily